MKEQAYSALRSMVAIRGPRIKYKALWGACSNLHPHDEAKWLDDVPVSWGIGARILCGECLRGRTGYPNNVDGYVELLDIEKRIA